MRKPYACKMPLGLRATFFLMQVPPDFYIPDIDEDEQNPDERMNRERLQNFGTLSVFFSDYILFKPLSIEFKFCHSRAHPRQANPA